MRMHQFILKAIFVFASLSATKLHAQMPYKGAGIVPSNPTSADSITYVRWEPNRLCFRFFPEHQVSMANNHITITFAKWNDTFGIVAALPPDDGLRHVDLVDLGRLPAGDYTLSTVNAPCNIFNFPPFLATPSDVERLPFKVTAARPKKTVFPFQIYPSLDLTGQWWDESDPGWALFVSQDSSDNLLVSWNSYASDGSPIWYVMQPSWRGPANTTTSDVWQTSKPPALGAIPTGITKLTKIGTSSLDVYFGERNAGVGSPNIEQYATFTYTLGTAPFVRRTLTRFKAR